VAWQQALVLALSVLAASASAGAFNQYVEADSDRLMARTRTRAFASGALPHTPAGWADRGMLLAVVPPPGVLNGWRRVRASRRVHLRVVYTVG
jgi:protoheme IX farnesyltransferase